MADRPLASGDGSLLSRARCRCGHLPTHHMAVAPVAGSSNFRLEPTGPCAICGEAVCRKYSPAGP